MITRFFQLIAIALLLPNAGAADSIFSRQTATPEARVVMASDSKATSSLQPQSEIVRQLVNRAVLHFSGKTNLASAWKTIVSSNDVVGIKVYSAPGPNSGTRPSVVAPVIEGLIAAGVPTNQIIIWDKEIFHLRAAGFFEMGERFNVRVESAAVSGYDENNFYENSLIGDLIFGDFEFGKKGSAIGRNSYVSKLVSREITKIISIAPLLNHNNAFTAGNLFSVAMGSVDNVRRFDRTDRLATALPEIYALPSVGDKVVLNITDALICQYQGEQRTLLHYSAALNQIWISKDPVALDVLAIRELDRQRMAAEIPARKIDLEIYQNASLLELGISDLKRIKIDNAP